MMHTTPLHIISPRSLDEAQAQARTHKSHAWLAGGSDLVPLMRKGLKQPECLIDLSRIPELRQIEMREQGLFIGAMAGLADLMRHQLVREHCPALSSAAGMTASPQIRGMATLGGNLWQDRRCVYFNQSAFWRQSLARCFKTGGSVCHQRPGSPKCLAIYHSDLAPVLLALKARAQCFGDNGPHEMPLKQLVHEHVKRNGTAQPGSGLLCGLIIPHGSLSSWCRFAKYSMRSSIDFALASAALSWLPPRTAGGRPGVSFYLGAMGPEPIELSQTQDLIAKTGSDPDMHRQDWIHAAHAEAGQKSSLIVDSALSVKVHKKALSLTAGLVEHLAGHLGSNKS